MKIIRLLILAGVVGLGYHWWQGRGDAPYPQGESRSGFIPVLMPAGAEPDRVLILAPINCPSEDAQRADELAAQLTRMGIPNTRSSSYSLAVDNPTREQKERMDRAVVVMNSEIPAVFVNGMAKANPTAEEVAAEYARTR